MPLLKDKVKVSALSFGSQGWGSYIMANISRKETNHASNRNKHSGECVRYIT
jgi:hypothetical protein